MKLIKIHLKLFTMVILLFFLLPSLSSYSNVGAIFENNNDSDRIIDDSDSVLRKCFILGYGEISGIYQFNKTWYFGGFYRGLYKGDLLIFNNEGMMDLGYFLSIYDFESKELLDKDEIPRYVYIGNYTGFLRANYYSHDHGPFGYYFAVFGFADYYYKYNS